MAMNEVQKNKLPPIVSDYIEKLNNPNQSKFTRESYCLVLENIIRECTDAVALYKKELASKVALKVARKK